MNDTFNLITLLTARAISLPIAYFFLSRSILIIKTAWMNNDQKKMNKGVAFLLVALVAIAMFFMLFEAI